jgi:pimeloyl-ACP methyl ester carboxylesterase
MDDVRTVMDAVGSEKAVVWTGGTSTGVGVLFAAMYPEKCAGLVLFDPRIRGTRSPNYPWAPRPELPGPGHFAAERIRGAELAELPEFRGVYTWVDDDAHRATMEATERFVSRLTRHGDLERVLATILYGHRRLDRAGSSHR